MMNRFQRVRAKVFLTLKGLWHRMTVGARVMVVDGDKVLLIRHTYVPGWQFPGGGVGPGETFEEAGARETLEETGYRVIGPMELFGLYHNSSPVTDRDHVAFYVAKRFEFVSERKPDHEIAEVGWFDRHKLPDKVTPATSQRIDEYFDGQEKRTVWGY
ncbi:NUDIX domain-containing protein [Devosia sp. XJ19-1]|uniref:NUDIX domain-containing protein n=1 Tax=Devosia ureilytica TaxID=2952754 RepID=A0A9Q4FSW0_9HYPH|nr:NUDIX domain-containing protein [Devosia ureilytica]MCP8883935.1 NUDIX domain-containing protein [Devosia ureilytica]MCP8887543.1 NUDIX domain-containing protein [Devosia ureilytica]